MTYRRIFATVAIAITLLLFAYNDAGAFDLFRVGRRHTSTADATVANCQNFTRWYPQYQTLDEYGGAVPTYAYGYFGAVGHSSYGSHKSYYGDVYQWSPLH